MALFLRYQPKLSYLFTCSLLMMNCASAMSVEKRKKRMRMIEGMEEAINVRERGDRDN